MPGPCLQNFRFTKVANIAVENGNFGNFGKSGIPLTKTSCHYQVFLYVIGNFGKCVVTDIYTSAGVAGFAVPPLSSNLAAVTQKASTLGLQLGL